METSRQMVDKWLEKRNDWLTYPISDIMVQKNITDEMIDSYTDLCIKESNQQNIQRKELNILDEYFFEEGNSYSIVNIKNVIGVNALKQNSELILNENCMNVIYGNNGSGKSGYTRILKKVTNSKYSESIKSNIYSLDTVTKQSCEIDIVKSGLDKEVIFCDLTTDKVDSTLSKTNTFDTLTSNGYIGELNESSYEPLIFTMLARLASVSDTVRKKINERIFKQTILPITIPAELEFHDRIKKIKNLDKDTVLVEKDYLFTEDNKKTVDKIRKELFENIDDKVKRIEIKNENIIVLNKYMNEVLEWLPEDEYQPIIKTIHKLDQLKEFGKILTSNFELSIDHIDKMSLSQESWKKMWKYAKEYMNFINLENATCPLCRQNMNADQVIRFNNVESYINSKNNYEISQLQKDIEKYKKLPFQIKHPSEVELIIKNIELDETTERLILQQFNKLTEYVNDIVIELKKDKIDSTTLMQLATDTRKVHESFKTQYEIIKGSLALEKDDLENLKNSEKICEKENELNDLLAKKFISENKEIIEKNINIFKLIDKLNKAKTLTNTQMITKLSNELASQILTNKYIQKFNEELKLLTNGKVKVVLEKGRSVKGKVPFKIMVNNELGENFEPNQILSEGEQRVVSLAAFLADSNTGNQQTPLIFDDPISSLDYEYEKNVVSRLVDLSKKRQVIIFTHRMSMLHGIIDGAKNKNYNYNEIVITSNGGTKGIITDQLVSSKKVSKANFNQLLDEISSIKKMNSSLVEYANSLNEITRKFRIYVEKTIEDVFTGSIIKRYSPEIKSSNVSRLSKITEEDCNMVDKMMSKYSFYQHSHSDELPQVDVDISELESDIKEYTIWIQEANKRINGN